MSAAVKVSGLFALAVAFLVAVGGCSTSSSRTDDPSRYPITQILDPVTEQVPDVH